MIKPNIYRSYMLPIAFLLCFLFSERTYCFERAYGGALYGSSPLRISTEFSIIFQPEKSNKGFSVSPEIGIGGGKIGMGYYVILRSSSIRIPLMSYSGRIAYLRTWGKPISTQINQNLFGIEAHYNFLFVSIKGGIFHSFISKDKGLYTFSFGFGI